MCSHGATCPQFSDDDTFPPSRTQSRGSTAVSLSAQADLASQEVEAEARPCLSTCRQPHTVCRTPQSSSHLVSQGWHHANPLCAGSLKWIQLSSQRSQRSLRRPEQEALDSQASQQLNSAVQTYRYPSLTSTPSCPAVPASWVHSPGQPCPAPIGPRTCTLGSDRHLTKHNSSFANALPSSNPLHRTEHGNPVLSLMPQSRSVSGQRLRQLVGAFLLAKGLLPNS